jgi:hypothetical protein
MTTARVIASYPVPKHEAAIKLHIELTVKTIDFKYPVVVFG